MEETKTCDDCNRTFMHFNVFTCEVCEKVQTCIDCVGTGYKLENNQPVGHYDTLCRKCLIQNFKDVDKSYSRRQGKNSIRNNYHIIF